MMVAGRNVSLAALVTLAVACSSAGDASVDTSGPETATAPATTPAPSTTTSAPDSTSTGTSTTSAAAPSTTAGPVDCGILRAGGSAIDVDGTGRSFNTYLPDDTGIADDTGSTRRPTLILLHGFGGQASTFATTTGLDQLAPAAGVNLVAPQGEGEVTTWHIGGDDNPMAVNDGAFLDQLVDELEASPCVDADNIWIAGFSAGSAYAAIYGCSNVERFAGIALVSGLPPALCPDDADVSIQITHGTDDAVVPFGGGNQAISDDAAVDLGSVPASAAGWAASAGCIGDAPPEDAAIELVFGDANPSRVTAWESCRGGAKVSLLAVEGLNHVWAGGVTPDFLDPVSPIMNAGCVMLATMTSGLDTPTTERFDACFGAAPQ